MGDANIITGKVIATGDESKLRIDDIEIITDKQMEAVLLNKTIEIAIRP